MVRYFASACLLVACGSDPGTPPISAEPPPAATTRQPLPVPPTPVPTMTAPTPTPEPTTESPIEAPPDPAPAAPPANGGCLPGYHDAPTHACCLIDVIPAGQCKCAEYDSRGKVTVPGEQCFDSCKFGEGGMPEFHSFCVPGGLSADRRL